MRKPGVKPGWIDQGPAARAEAVVSFILWHVLGLAAEGFRYGVQRAWSIPDPEVEAGEELRPPHVAWSQLLRCTEGLQVLVVCHDLEGVSTALKFWAPLLEGFDHREELFVVDVVVAFLSGVLGREVGDGVQVAVIAVR